MRATRNAGFVRSGCLELAALVFFGMLAVAVLGVVGHALGWWR